MRYTPDNVGMILVQSSLLVLIPLYVLQELPTFLWDHLRTENSSGGNHQIPFTEIANRILFISRTDFQTSVGARIFLLARLTEITPE